MHISIGLENGNDDRSIAWALDYPGCFAYGKDAAEAIVSMAPAMVKYQDWVARHTDQSWLAGLGDFDVRLTEVFEDYRIDKNYNLAGPGPGTYGVEAWFRHDWKPLTAEEVERDRLLLQWSREELLTAVSDLSAAELDAAFPGERWSIRGILSHVASAERWYLECLNLTDLVWAELPTDAFQRLELVREEFNKKMPGLTGHEQVTGKNGELWSPRKLIRRALWHELDHIGHIYQLVIALPNG